MRVAAVMSDLMLYSRIESAATAAGAALSRLDTPTQLPSADAIDLVLVDWSARRADWAGTLSDWRDQSDTRIVLFGQHTDLEAHAAARAAGLGPMWARSKLIGQLPSLLRRGMR